MEQALILAFVRPREPDNWPGLPTDHLLQALKRWIPGSFSGFPTSSPGVAAANAHIMEALEQTIPLHSKEEIQLEEFLEYIHDATVGPGGTGIPIFADPIGLMEANKTISFTVYNIELEGVELKSGLRLALAQRGLGYNVRNGYLRITSAEYARTPIFLDPFIIVGHCLLALLAAGCGAILSPLVPGKRREMEAGMPEHTETAGTA